MNSELALRPLLLENVQQTRRELGRGAYGVVLEVKVNGTICAAKKLHDLIVQVDFLYLSPQCLYFIIVIGNHIAKVHWRDSSS